MRTDENGSSKKGCSDKNYCQPDEELKTKGDGGGVCTQCHTDGSPQIPQDPNSDWNSGKYSGCFMCHAAQAYNQTSLTNSQLAAYNSSLHYYGGYYGVAMVEGAAIGMGIGWSLPTTTAGAAVCASNAECAENVQEAGVTVLGYSEDVAFYQEVEVNTLYNRPGYSWEGMNVPFLNDAMARNDTIVFVSDFAQFPERTFPKEVLYLLEHDYTNIVDLFGH